MCRKTLGANNCKRDWKNSKSSAKASHSKALTSRAPSLSWIKRWKSVKTSVCSWSRPKRRNRPNLKSSRRKSSFWTTSRRSSPAWRTLHCLYKTTSMSRQPKVKLSSLSWRNYQSHCGLSTRSSKFSLVTIHNLIWTSRSKESMVMSRRVMKT